MGRTMFNSDYMSPKQIEQMKKDSQPPLCEICEEPYLFEEMMDGICLDCLEVDNG